MSAKYSRTETSAKRLRRPEWATLPDEALLDLRMCDLGLKIEDTVLVERIEKVQSELAQRNLDFQPHFWLSSEWFTPDGVPGTAIPFYLAHPRLMRLEKNQMFEIEGGRHDWCLRLLRHEIGHALDNAFLLRRRRAWQNVFGKASQPYPDFYQPKPYSKRYVLHLDYWYAQSHPSEDFAETFAVWLNRGSRWRKRYQGWPALRKLEFVDELMKEIAGTKPRVRTREKVEPLHKIKTTLREHYREKRSRYGTGYPDFYDRDLRKLFSADTSGESAARFLARIRPQVRRLVAEWTGEYQYTIDQVLQEMVARCRELKLRVNKPREQAQLEAAVLLTVQTMNYLHDGHHRLAV